MKRVLVWLLALLLLCSLVGCGQAKPLRFGTGGAGGSYYGFGNALAEMIAKDNKALSLDVKTTAGSAANLRLLREGFLQLAVVQSDTLSQAAAGTGLFADAGPCDGYAAIAGLYCEACQIVVREDSSIGSVYDLAGLRVSVGEKESGVRKNAEEILRSHGIGMDMIEVSYLSFADAASALKKGEIDAFFCTAGTPTNAVAQLAAETEIRLLPISPEVRENMMKMDKGYTACVIPANTYPGQTREVVTLGVKAVLIASPDVDKETASYIARFVQENGERLRNTVNVPLENELAFAVSDIPCPFHEGAAAYYGSRGVTVETASAGSVGSVSASQE